MRPAIIIKKVKEEEAIYYYSVSTVFEGFQCYIGIDQKNNRINFFNSTSFNEPIGIIDFNLPNHLTKIQGIDLWITNKVALQAFNAIQKKVFPEELTVSN